MGLCALGAAGLAELPQTGCLIGDFALPLLRRGGRVLTLPSTSPYVLPGDSVAEYVAGNLAWLERTRGSASFVAEDAEIAREVELEQCVVGRGARVLGAGTLARSVVWPGGTARAPLADAVVTKENMIVKT